jgi:hypothetical protein
MSLAMPQRPAMRWIDLPIQGLRQWRWTHTALGVAIGVANIVLGPAGGLLFWPIPWADKRYELALLLHVLMFGLPIVWAVRCADAAVMRGASALPAYALAVLVVAAGGSWAGWALGLSVWAGQVATQLRNAWLAVGIATLYGLGVAAYALWRRAEAALARAHAVETDRLRRMHDLQLQQLRALQARVEPQLLFDTLGRVQADVRFDAAAADRRLADLITLLRAMLHAHGLADDRPLRQLQDEIELLQASAMVRDEPPPTLHADADCRAAKLAPMLLLPLARAWRSATGAGAGMQLRARRQGARLALQIAPADAQAQASRATVPAALLEPLRERLHALHGHQASLEASAGPVLTLQLPLADEDGAHPPGPPTP